MKIIYTDHLKFRLKIRKISQDLPKYILKYADEHYYDNLSRHLIAVHQVEFKGKIREMMVSYDVKKDVIELITIHPLKTYQKISRLKTGRWRKI